MVAIIVPEMNDKELMICNIAVALSSFLGAACVTGQLGHWIGPRIRFWLIVCNSVQTALVFAAAAVQYVRGTELPGSHTLAVIALLAAASGSQVVQSRALAITEISTAMATAAWVDFVIDAHLLSAKNRSRNRRLYFLVALVAGSLFGALIYLKISSPAAIAISGAGKLVATTMYFFSPAEKKETRVGNNTA